MPIPLPISRDPLEPLLDALATKMRRRILRDRGHGLEPHEETHTQNFVSDLTDGLSLVGSKAFAHEIPRHLEARLYGADIAFWIQNKQGHLAGILVQAKRQFYRDDTYRDLDHSNKTGGKQYQLLVDSAKAAGLLAGYAFYNGLTPGQPSSTACGFHLLDPDLNGITVASALTLHREGLIQHVVPRVSVEPTTAPLGCLIRCGSRWQKTDPAQALYDWHIFADPLDDQWAPKFHDPSNAPEYLKPLLAAADNSDEVVDVPQFDVGYGYDDADGDEGGAFVTVILIRQD
jgi:hypothetical protein